MRNKIALLYAIMIFLMNSTVACCETLKMDDLSVHYTVPEGWLCANTHDLYEVSSKLACSPEEIISLTDIEQGTILFYPQDAFYDFQHYVVLSLTPMESYQRNYSALSAEQLNNVGNSFLKSGEYDSVETVQTEQGLTLLKLHSVAESSPGNREIVYVTNENGIKITLECYGDTSSSEITNSLLSVFDSIVVRGKSPDYWELFIRYRAFLTIPLTPLLIILFRELKKKKARQ